MRKNVSSACRACKARKLKCSGVTPCETCVRSKQECIIDVEGDQRRRLNLKRKIDSLEADRQILVRLIESLRTGHQSHIPDLLACIRSSTSLDKIKSFLDSYGPRMETEPAPQMKEMFLELQRLEQSRQRPSGLLATGQISNTLLFTVPAKPWTTVTDDDHFVSHLISIWLTWHHPWSQCIDPAIFIRAMQLGDLKSSLCSPFLVNAILAEASFLSDDPQTCAIGGDFKTKGNRFFAEAKKLLDNEEGMLSIPTIQGLVIMFECAFAMGKDRAGWVYTIQAIEGMRTIRNKKTRLILETGLSTADLGCLMHRIELSQFNVFLCGALALQVPPLVKKLHGYRFPNNCVASKEVFVPYPRTERPLPAHNDCIMNTLAQMGDIVWDIATFIAREERASTQIDLVDAVEQWRARLAKSWEMRPRCVDREINPVPGILTVYMYYHTIVITMYACLKGVRSEANDCLLEWAERAQQICLTSAHTVAQIMETQQLRWGADAGPLVNAHFINISQYILMEDLSNPESHRAFMSLCRAHIQYAKRCPLHRGTVRMVQLTAQRMKDPLPEDVVAHFREFEEQYWRPDSGRRFSSRYPNFAIAIRQGADYMPDDLELDAFLEKWVSLDDER